MATRWAPPPRCATRSPVVRRSSQAAPTQPCASGPSTCKAAELLFIPSAIKYYSEQRRVVALPGLHGLALAPTLPLGVRHAINMIKKICRWVVRGKDNQAAEMAACGSLWPHAPLTMRAGCPGMCRPHHETQEDGKDLHDEEPAGVVARSSASSFIATPLTRMIVVPCRTHLRTPPQQAAGKLKQVMCAHTSHRPRPCQHCVGCAPVAADS